MSTFIGDKTLSRLLGGQEVSRGRSLLYTWTHTHTHTQNKLAVQTRKAPFEAAAARAATLVRQSAALTCIGGEVGMEGVTLGEGGARLCACHQNTLLKQDPPSPLGAKTKVSERSLAE